MCQKAVGRLFKAHPFSSLYILLGFQVVFTLIIWHALGNPAEAIDLDKITQQFFLSVTELGIPGDFMVNIGGVVFITFWVIVATLIFHCCLWFNETTYKSQRATQKKIDVCRLILFLSNSKYLYTYHLFYGKYNI